MDTVKKSFFTEDDNFTWEDICNMRQSDRPPIHPVIDSGKIPGFKEWLFLNGFRDPIPSHPAFDFSAYEKDNGRINLGLPPTTKIHAPLKGKVMKSSCHRKPSYGGGVEISHNPKGIMGTALWHIVPCVEPGEYVATGQEIGTIYAKRGTSEGHLPHLHVSMRPLNFRYLSDFSDPKEILFSQEKPLKRLELPHPGQFLKSELAELGIDVRYEILLYMQSVEGFIGEPKFSLKELRTRLGKNIMRRFSTRVLDFFNHGTE